MITIPASLTLTFSLFVAATFAALIWVYRKTVVNSTAKNKWLPFIILLLLQAAFAVMAIQHVFLDTLRSTPPAFMPAVLSMVVLAIYLAIYYKPFGEFSGERMKYAVALQTFRLPLELLFVWALSVGVLPVQMTFEGRNPDILVGVIAPLIAWLGYHKKVLPKWVLIGWNFAGLALLFNIVIIAILSTPSNFRVFTQEPANTLVMLFPYQFIPFFLVPLAFFTHIFALRKLLVRGE